MLLRREYKILISTVANTPCSTVCKTYYTGSYFCHMSVLGNQGRILGGALGARAPRSQKGAPKKERERKREGRKGEKEGRKREQERKKIEKKKKLKSM